MDDAQGQDEYEERLKEVFNSFDTSGCGSLCPEELSDLCQSLHLEDATPILLHTLLQDQDHLTARVDFEQFKNALILILSSTIEAPQQEPETLQEPESPEIQPKFVKGSKRYGRRSTPELIEPISGLSEITNANLAEGEAFEDNYDSAVPRKRERWNAHECGTEEYEAEGQMHLWNPDEPNTPRGSCLEERLREACEELAISWDRCAGHTELLTLCEHLGLEINEEVLLSLNGDGVMNVQEFVSRAVNLNKPLTPSASTPYRQLKRHHSTQPFDEGGRRFATPSALTSTIGMRLFSTLDDGTGFTPAEYILDSWTEEGIENGSEILQALNFDLDGKLSLGDLTMALENELLVTKNGIHQAALASFKAELRHLLEQVDREFREKEKIRSDLEKAEKLKNQLATEVDEHHSAIEHTNNLKLRKLEQDHKEKLAAVRSELMQEIERLQQQVGLQREELEREMVKTREDESFLRDHLSISVKENRRLEMELLDSTEKLVDAQSQITKLQTSLDNVMKEKFGDLDPGSSEFFLQEERYKQLRNGYETQCRELQDRIDELQSELQEFHSLGRVHQPCNKPLSEELESKSPGMESDPGIGSEEVQPFSLSLEAEMMLERLKEQHFQEMEELRNQLESKITDVDQIVERQRATHEGQKAFLALQHQQEVQALREEMASVQSQTQELQSQLDQVELERRCLVTKLAGEREELENLQEEEVGNLRQQLLETHTYAADLEDQLKNLEAQFSETEENCHNQVDGLKKQHAVEIKKLEERHVKVSEARLEEGIHKLQGEKAELERRLLDDFQREKEELKRNHEVQLKAKLAEAKMAFKKEQDEIVQNLTEQWGTERAQLDEQSNESLQVLLEEEMLRLVKEQEEKDAKLREQWEAERAQLQQQHEDDVLQRIHEERKQLQMQFQQKEKRLKEEWGRERLQLEEDYEGMLDDRLIEEREKFETEKEDVEKKLKDLMAEEMARLEERHRGAVKELTTKHSEERSTLSRMLDKLRDGFAQERREMEVSFTQRIKEVEKRFSGHQESVEERFEARVLKLEQHYQSRLKVLSESHGEQKLHWEAQMQEHEKADAQRRRMDEVVKQERESLNQKWIQELRELEGFHEEELHKIIVKNQELQNELDNCISLNQAKELELSRQLRKPLQESPKVLLNQTELEAKYNEMRAISEQHVLERIELLTERDDLKMTIEELEMLLKQAAVDFDLDRKELQECVTVLEGKLKDNLENDEVLKSRVKELEKELDQVLTFIEKVEKEEKRELNNERERCLTPNVGIGDCINFSNQELVCLSPSVGEQDVEVENIWDVLHSVDEGSEHIMDDESLATDNDDDHMVEMKTPEQDHQMGLTENKENQVGFVSNFERNDMTCSLLKLMGLYNTATDENVLLHEKISLLQQKTELLENLLAHNGEAMKTGHRILEENYSLKVKMVLLMEHVKKLEMKAIKMTDVEIRYEDCMCENAKLKEQNGELEKTLWSLETRMNIFLDLKDEQFREENTELFEELETQGEILSALDPDVGHLDISPTGEDLLGLEAEVEAVSDLEDDCEHFEKENTNMCRSLSELQDKSQTLNETTRAHRSEVCRLAEENLLLGQKMTALKEEDLKEAKEELTQTLEHLKNERTAARRVAETFQRQIAELKKENESREVFPAEDKNKLAACVTSLEAELTKALEDTAQLEERNSQLSLLLSGFRDKVTKFDSMENQLGNLLEERKSVDKETQSLRSQLAKALERVKAVDETSLTVNHQSARLKADVRVLQKERESLKHEVVVLHKRLQNANDKHHILEMALHSSGLQNQSKKRLKDELSRLMEQEQLLLRQDNERLQAEVRGVKGDLVQSREKVRHLDATVLSLKQQKQPNHLALVKALEMENASLKQELEAQKELNKSCEAGQGRTPSLESLQQENEALKDQMALLSTQLLESFQAHLVGLLPPSPHRVPRGQHRGEDPDNMQDDRERKLKNMEERMSEIELSLHNVKLLLKEKVAQLKDQLNKNGKADVLINDLYVENAQLMKALEITEQRHKIADKKNYLLEEKISSLNKIVRDLNPSLLPALPYHYKCS